MNDSAHLYRLTRKPIIDGEREPLHEHSAQPSIHDGASPRHVAEQLYGLMEFRLEFHTEPDALSLIIRKSLRDISEGFGTKLDLELHSAGGRRRRSRT